MTVPSLSPFSTARCACAGIRQRKLRRRYCGCAGPAASHSVISACAAAAAAAAARTAPAAQGDDALLHQFAHRHDRRAVAVGGVDRDGRIHAHQFQRGRDIAAEIDIDHAVDAALSGERHRLGDDVVGLVVDDEIGAGEPRLLGLGRRTDGRDHLRAAPFRKLHRVVADRAGAAGDQHGLADDRSVAKQAAPRGHAGDAEGGAFRERQIGPAAASPDARQARYIPPRCRRRGRCAGR